MENKNSSKITVDLNSAGEALTELEMHILYAIYGKINHYEKKKNLK